MVLEGDPVSHARWSLRRRIETLALAGLLGYFLYVGRASACAFTGGMASRIEKPSFQRPHGNGAVLASCTVA